MTFEAQGKFLGELIVGSAFRNHIWLAPISVWLPRLTLFLPLLKLAAFRLKD
jgi:hypothetical protein